MEVHQDTVQRIIRNGPGSLEMRVVQAQQTLMAELASMTRSLVPAHGHLAVVPSANAPTVSDCHANIEHIGAIMHSLD